MKVAENLTILNAKRAKRFQCRDIWRYEHSIDSFFNDTPRYSVVLFALSYIEKYFPIFSKQDLEVRKLCSREISWCLVPTLSRCKGWFLLCLLSGW